MQYLDYSVPDVVHGTSYTYGDSICLSTPVSVPVEEYEKVKSEPETVDLTTIDSFINVDVLNNCASQSAFFITSSFALASLLMLLMFGALKAFSLIRIIK